MTARLYSSVRPYLGAVALTLGCIGLFLFAFEVPFSAWTAHFWGGFVRKGPQPTAAQREAAESALFQWALWHRDVPSLLTSLALLGYGFYEAYNEQVSTAARLRRAAPGPESGAAASAPAGCLWLRLWPSGFSLNVFDLCAIASPTAGAIAGFISDSTHCLASSVQAIGSGLLIGLALYFAAMGFTGLMLRVPGVSTKTERLSPLQCPASMAGVLAPGLAPFAAWALSVFVIRRLLEL